MREKDLVLTHADMDGIVAAAVFEYLSSNDPIEKEREFKYVVYSKQKEIFKETSRRDLSGTTLYVLDLNSNDCLIEGNEPILKRIARNAKEVLWFDHHAGTNKFKNLLQDWGVKVFDGYDSKICASRLMYLCYPCHFLRGNKYFDWLTSIAQVSDYSPGSEGEIAKIGRDINSVISFHLFKSDIGALNELVITLSRGREWHKNGIYSREIESALSVWRLYQKKAIAELKKSIETIEINGKKIVLGFTLGILPAKDTIAGLKKQKEETGDRADCYIIAFGMPINGTLVLANKDDFPVMDFCRAMRGGGRPFEDDSQGGGFSFVFDITEKSYTNARQIIIGGLYKFFKKHKSRTV